MTRSPVPNNTCCQNNKKETDLFIRKISGPIYLFSKGVGFVFLYGEYAEYAPGQEDGLSRQLAPRRGTLPRSEAL